MRFESETRERHRREGRGGGRESGESIDEENRKYLARSKAKRRYQIAHANDACLSLNFSPRWRVEQRGRARSSERRRSAFAFAKGVRRRDTSFHRTSCQFVLEDTRRHPLLFWILQTSLSPRLTRNCGLPQATGLLALAYAYDTPSTSLAA